MPEKREQTRLICERFKRAIAKGIDQRTIIGELAADYCVQRPAIWKTLRRGGVVEEYRPRKENGSGRPRGGGVSGYTQRRYERAREIAQEITLRREKMLAQPRVDRDACPRCGVRRDVGCKHSRAQLGMSFGVRAGGGL